MTRKRISTSAALSAEVGSSMIRMRTSCGKRLGDLDDLLLADAQVARPGVAGSMPVSSRASSAPARSLLALAIDVDADAA